jgi:hypothetical protein
MNVFGASNVRAELLFILAGVIVFVAFFVVARLVAGRAAKALRQRGLRHDVVVLGTRVIMVLVIGIGALAGVSFALESGNVVLAGIVVATIVATTIPARTTVPLSNAKLKPARAPRPMTRTMMTRVPSTTTS